MSEFEIANDDGQRNNFPTKFMNKNRFNAEKRDMKSIKQQQQQTNKTKHKYLKRFGNNFPIFMCTQHFLRAILDNHNIKKPHTHDCKLHYK